MRKGPLRIRALPVLAHGRIKQSRLQGRAGLSMYSLGRYGGPASGSFDRWQPAPLQTEDSDDTQA